MESSNFIALIALVFAVLSFVIGILFNYFVFLKNEKHDVLINTPFFDVEFKTGIKTGEFSISLSNNGLGPGLIKSIIYEHNGVRFTHFKGLLESEFDLLLKSKESLQSVSFKDPRSVIIDPGYCLSEKSSCVLGSVVVSTKDIAFQNEILNRFRRIRVIVQFTDIFKNEYTITDSVLVL